MSMYFDVNYVMKTLFGRFGILAYLVVKNIFSAHNVFNYLFFFCLPFIDYEQMFLNSV